MRNDGERRERGWGRSTWFSDGGRGLCLSRAGMGGGGGGGGVFQARCCKMRRKGQGLESSKIKSGIEDTSTY